jgi:exodeoxyribonuclease V gamma subunit
MLHLHTAGRADVLAGALADVLANAPSDPMTPEWIAAPSLGVHRWLSLELGRRLGVAAPGQSDGVSANVTRAFPDTLRDRVLEAGRGRDGDPWEVERLVWTVLAVAAGAAGGDRLTAFSQPDLGPSRYARARRVADLFDRYHRHRPAMVRAWRAGLDIDGLGQPLGGHQAWQPHLWRLVRRAIALPSPPERTEELLARLADGSLELGLPDRLNLFGLAVLPGGADFLDLASGVAASHELHLYMLQPSHYDEATLRSVLDRSRRIGPWPRSDDPSLALDCHPLLASWGALLRETSVLLAASTSLPAPQPVPAPVEGPASTLLGQLQADLRANRRPGASFVPDPDDRTVQFHACHGERRQVEVLRDALLHLLADPSLGLREEDIVVLCPSLERFAPLVEGIFGPSADAAAAPVATTAAPRLRYRIADRSLRSGNAVLNAMAVLVDLIGGRFEAPAVLDFLSLAPVRQRFGLTDVAVAAIESWVVETNVRWGLDDGHRAAHGIAVGDANTWRAGADRLLLGVATQDGDLRIGLGDTVPYGVEGDDAETLGNLAEILWNLAELAGETTTERPIRHWVDLFRQAAVRLFCPPPDAQWQLDALDSLLAKLVESASESVGSGETGISYGDVRAVFSERLAAEAGRPDFFRGGITVTSLSSLRWVPFWVVCLLGMDQAAFGAANVDGDDLVAERPVVGDRDPRAEVRQQLLEAVLAPSDHLVLIRDGHSVRTNQEIPPAVVVAELRDALLATVEPGSGASLAGRLEVHHPRQPYDERCFERGGLLARDAWSFDPAELANAEARRTRLTEPAPFLGARLADPGADLVDLVELHRFLKHPVEYFMGERLGLRFPRDEDDPSGLLPVELDGLGRYEVGDRLLQAVLDGADLEACTRFERGLGLLPTGPLGDAVLVALVPTVEALRRGAEAAGVQRQAIDVEAVDVVLPDGTRLVGDVVCGLAGAVRGPARVRYVRYKHHQKLAAWLDLVALTATFPATEWHSVVASRAVSGDAPKVVNLAVAPGDPHQLALDALTVIVDCFRRGSREPIPFFPGLSYELFRGAENEAVKAWEGTDFRPGERSNPASALAFGRVAAQELLDTPAQPGDPPGRGGRVRRFAHYLYATMEQTTQELPPPGGTP